MSRMPIKLISNLTDEFWNMRNKFKNESLLCGNVKLIENDDPLLWFDFPDYFGLSKKVGWKLSSDFVDSLQSELFGELQNGIGSYKEIFKSKKTLNKKLIEIWEIYGRCA